MSSDADGPLGLADLTPELQDLLAPRVERLGYLGAFFSHAARQPDALLHFCHFTDALKAALPERTVEIIALVVAGETGNAYERHQHERLALKIGMDADEVRALGTGSLHAFPSFSPAERAVHALATCVTRHWGRGCEPAFLRVRRAVGEETAVACLLMAGRYVAHAVIANSWGLKPPVASPLSTTEESNQ